MKRYLFLLLMMFVWLAGYGQSLYYIDTSGASDIAPVSAIALLEFKDMQVRIISTDNRVLATCPLADGCSFVMRDNTVGVAAVKESSPKVVFRDDVLYVSRVFCDAQAVVYDMKGRVIRKCRLRKGETSAISLSGVGKGVLVLSIDDINVKFVK